MDTLILWGSSDCTLLPLTFKHPDLGENSLTPLPVPETSRILALNYLCCVYLGYVHMVMRLDAQKVCSEGLSEYLFSCLTGQAPTRRLPSNICPLERTSSPTWRETFYICLGVSIRVLEKLWKGSKANANLFSWEVLVMIRSYLGQWVHP